jgi:nucleoside-diphosphate-sugar epimerase
MRVGILGCGYVGTELGRQLLDDGHDVVGVVRSAESVDRISKVGLDAVQADLTDRESLSTIPDVDALVFAASAGRGSVETARKLYLGGLENIVDEFAGRASSPARLLFTSSTGVYGDHDGDWVDESTPVAPASPKAEVIADAESLVRAGPITGTVARFAGLYGPGRYRLDRYLSGPVTAGYRNSTHRNDAAGALAHFLTADVARGETVLVTDDRPVEKWAFAEWLAEECGVEPPQKQTLAERLEEASLSPEAERRLRSQKRCRNDRLHEFGYELRVPSVYEGYRPAIAAYLAGEDPDAR